MSSNARQVVPEKEERSCHLEFCVRCMVLKSYGLNLDKRQPMQSTTLDKKEELEINHTEKNMIQISLLLETNVVHT